MITLVALTVLAIVQGWLMQTAVALTGDPAPRFGRALWSGLLTLFTFTVAQFTWSWTVGVFMKLFVGSFFATGLGFGLALLLAALVVRSRLRFTYGHALAITALHVLFTSGAKYVVDLLVG